jgi:uncharacterized protein (DUF2252 family)
MTEQAREQGTHLSPEERRAIGKAARKAVPRSSHADWSPGPDRPDPVALIEGQDTDRLQWLVPVRRGRMSVSAFTFYRGAARVMATDLATTPSSGLTVQACGDAHLANFGMYGSPERKLVFDINDFDETLPGPWEWDVKRLAASFMIAGRHRGFSDADNRTITATSVASYRQTMAEMAGTRTLDVWYAHLAMDDLDSLLLSQGATKASKRAQRTAKKARSKDSLQALRKLAEKVDGRYRIKSDPPVLVPLREIGDQAEQDRIREEALKSFKEYRSTMRPDRQLLLDRFRPVDIAVKVVGVGSVGTRCMIVLLEGRDEADPLFLQIKEATKSVLEEHLPAGRWRNSGKRVVVGQRLMQSSSDVFLGWSRSVAGREYYWRQLRDWKGSMDIDSAGRKGLTLYAQVCGWTLARSHARSGDPIAIAAYMGTGTVFDKAITEFSEKYADQNESDYAEFDGAIRDGTLVADTSG